MNCCNIPHRYRHIPNFVIDNLDSISTIRRTLRISITTIARACGISTDTISDTERGLTFPHKKNYNKLAAFFDWEVWL